jgi:formylglycine-generating enzyme required for sulfatase activity
MESTAVKVFISYSHKDEDLRKELDTHLKILERQGYISPWHDRKIEAGDEWKKEITTYLENADVILLLVSANFLASDFCYDIETKRALERQKADGALIVPIILKPCAWKESPVSSFQVMPKDGKPISIWNDQDLAFTDITEKLKEKAKQLIERRKQQHLQTQQQAAREEYRQKLEEYLADGVLSALEQENLQELAQARGIAPTDAEEMNTQALNQRQEYEEKLERYRQAFERAIQDQFPLSPTTRALLKERQDIARLQEADVKRVEQEALDAREKALAEPKTVTTTDISATPTPPAQEPPPVTQPATPVDVAPAKAPEPPAVEGDFTEQLGNGVELEMVKIPAGQFWMGSPDNEAERLDSEGPQHLVTVPEFWMGKYPVTQKQWQKVAALPKVKRDLKPFPSRFKGDQLPVEQVSWYDAEEFCQRLSQKTGRTYRLPSEAEWEYACRAGTTTRYYFGDSITGEQVNCDSRKTVVVNEGILGIGRKEEKRGIYREKTTDVGSFPPNKFGLYDMHGNV